MVKKWIRVDNGKLLQVLEYKNNQRVEIPINADGSIRWLPDKMKKTQKQK